MYNEEDSVEQGNAKVTSGQCVETGWGCVLDEFPLICVSRVVEGVGWGRVEHLEGIEWWNYDVTL